MPTLTTFRSAVASLPPPLLAGPVSSRARMPPRPMKHPVVIAPEYLVELRRRIEEGRVP